MNKTQRDKDNINNRHDENSVKRHYKNIIIGGGIVGAGIFRDLSLHDEEVLIIDRNDFTSQTSQSSSKMLHGGIRYLENFDFQLVHEALHEKIYWTKLLPHLAKEVPFVLPTYKESKHPKLMLKIGLFLYDFLSGFNNSPHKMLSKNEVLDKVKNINPENLTGGGLYYDAVMEDAKITLEVIYDGLISEKSYAWNYHEIKSVTKHGEINLLKIKNTLSNDEIEVTCSNLIFALGPFTDKVLSQLFPDNWKPILLPSKGSHIWVKRDRLELNHPMVINHQDGRVIFFIPHDKKVLIGTTEVETSIQDEKISISKKELNYLISITNQYFRNVNITESDILSSFSGIRPLIKDNRSAGNKGKTARTHKTYQIGKDIFVIAGGKYTTFRVMGQEITRNILNKSNKKYSSRKTLNPLRKRSIVKDPKSWSPNTEDIIKIIENEVPKTMNDLIYRRIGIHSQEEWDLTYPDIKYENFIEKIKHLI